jgi:hypothetical protein
MSKNKGKFIDFEKLDCNLLYTLSFKVLLCICLEISCSSFIIFSCFSVDVLTISKILEKLIISDWYYQNIKK